MLFVFAGNGSNEAKPANSTVTNPVAQSSDSEATTQNAVPEESSQTNADTEKLKQAFLTLSSETKRDDVDNLAEQYGLYSSHRNTGTGTYVYRIAETRDIASVNTKAKGSVVTISFNALQSDAVSEITYFDVDWISSHSF